ncbi:CLUMA_CG005923, isoform A [Clunio marinus]|uniref:CLUMA_CG005923, isoform A n=1 Tax=Clunio marinus TaxID=568069 RepID=A0A1J1HWF5_9DIPT|nr:CLUMA_CG005923, isoform A [Clunio marinus]
MFDFITNYASINLLPAIFASLFASIHFHNKTMLRKSLNLIQVYSSNQFRQNIRTLYVSATNEAARKGTREKARAKKVKVEIKKVAFVPFNRKKLKIDMTNKHIDDSWKAIPADDVYVGKYYRWRVYTAPEAIEAHKETHHPSMYNEPNAPLFAHVELNMQGEKVTRFVENFYRIAPVQHKFDHGQERTILVFTKGQENIEMAKNAGATYVGGTELVKDIQNGDLLLTDYQYAIAHPNILPDLLPIRGLMKKKYPNPKNGTLGADLDEIIRRFQNGIQYSAMKDENQKDFGLITAQIGTLDMETSHLEENLASLLKDVNTVRPKRAGKFITRVLLKSPPSKEQLKIDPFVYVDVGKPEVKKEVTLKKSKKRGRSFAKSVDEEEVVEPAVKEAAN